MKKILMSFIFLLMAIILTGCEGATSAIGNTAVENDKPAAVKSDYTASNQPMSSAEAVADRLEVYYFHRSARCSSCQTISRFVSETMSSRFADEIKSGQIDYREINVEEPENEEIALKFQASGSSLFFNRITDGKDNIEQDTDIWLLLFDEAKLKKHLEDKINTSLKI